MAENKSDNLAAQIFGGEAADNASNQKEETKAAPATGEPQEEGKQGEGQPSKLYAGKFTSIEELEKAYLEGQKWWTRTSQEAAAAKREAEQLRRELEELRKALAPDMSKSQQQAFEEQVKKAIQAAVVDEDPKLLLQLIDQLTEYKTEQKLRQITPIIEPIARQNVLEQHVEEFFAEVPEAKELEAEMARLVQEDPSLVYDAKGNIKPNWPYRVYARVLKLRSGQAKRANEEAAAQMAAMKMAAGVSGSTARTSQPQPESEEEKLKKAIFGEGGKRRMFDY